MITTPQRSESPIAQVKLSRRMLNKRNRGKVSLGLAFGLGSGLLSFKVSNTCLSNTSAPLTLDLGDTVMTNSADVSMTIYFKVLKFGSKVRSYTLFKDALR